jgi:hypothetical protein
VIRWAQRGHDTGAEAPKGTVRGGAAQQRRTSTPASDSTDSRTVKGKSRAWVGWLPREMTLERLSNGEDTARALVDGGRDSATWREFW